jgi:8-oxo-dGTP diphosphatase
VSSDDYTATLPRKRMGAGALLSDAEGRILLVQPSYKPEWEIPGGCVEADESPLTAVVRELREELGLDLQPSRLLVTDWVPPQLDRTEGLMMLFDGGVLDTEQSAAIRLPPDELLSWAWCTTEDAQQRLPPLLARRIITAMHARAEQSCVYLENGFPPGAASEV